MTKIRERLTFANATSVLALFIALGGSAYAALGKNTVGTKQLKNGAVTTGKIRDGAVTGAKVSGVGLGSLLGGSGTAINETTVIQTSGTCGRYAFAAPGAQLGDTVILAGSDAVALAHAIVGAPTITNANQLNATICAGTTTISQAPTAIQLRFDTLR